MQIHLLPYHHSERWTENYRSRFPCDFVRALRYLQCPTGLQARFDAMKTPWKVPILQLFAQCILDSRVTRHSLSTPFFSSCSEVRPVCPPVPGKESWRSLISDYSVDISWVAYIHYVCHRCVRHDGCWIGVTGTTLISLYIEVIHCLCACVVELTAWPITIGLNN